MIAEASIAQLRHFRLVAESRSFHAAAERAFRSQPAISLSIRQLESRLGQPLFEANRKAVELTAFGALCLPRVVELLDFHDRSLAEIERLATSASGAVALATVPSVAARLLPAVIERFAAAYPDIELSITDDNARVAQRSVLSRQVDLAVSSIWEADSRLTFTPLLKDSMGLVCRDDHPLARENAPLSWQRLRGHRLIDNGTTRLLAGTAAYPIAKDAAHLSISNMISLTAVLEAGLGAAVLPRLALPSGHERLRFIPLNEPEVEREIGILQLAGHAPTPAADALRRLLVEALGSNG